jgi:trimethylamine--corrinoid protein Co-methyltransferase
MNVSLLSPEQIAAVRTASLEILERIGFVVPHEETLQRFADAGASVDFAGERVRVPPELVERSLASAGKQFRIYGRDASRQAAFGVGRRNYNSIAGEALWVDAPGAPRRYCTLEDVATAARFGDALPWIHIVGAMSDPHEIPVAWRCVAVMAELLRNTTKPITFWYHDRASAAFLTEMMVAVRGSEEAAREQPLCYPFLEPISPLRFPRNGVDLLYETARLNLPVPIGPMAQMGLSAPATIAGTLAQENAEILAGICITQLIRPGMPVCYGGICHAFDMQTTQLIFSGPEQALFGVAMTQIGKSYGLPVYINVGLTDAKRPDAQAGLEAGVTLMLGAAAGADIYGHLGISGADQATSIEMLVLQHEVVSYVESVLREIEVGPESLAIDELAAVGPGGSFLDRVHTARNFRKSLWFPQILDRNFYDGWHVLGAPSTEERCVWRREELAGRQPEPLAPDVDRELTRIVDAAKRRLGGEG